MLLALGGGYWFWQQSLVKEAEPLPELALPDPDAPAVVDETAIDATDSDAEPDEDLEVTEPAVEPVEAAPVAGTGKTFQDAPGSLMVQLPAGSFTMGSPDSAAEFSERPQHSVKLASFAISVNEVTIAEYRKFVAATGRRPPKTEDLDPAKHPVFFVSWDDALAYTQWLSKQTGHDYRLPSEAQWEFAARVGTTGNY